MDAATREKSTFQRNSKVSRTHEPSLANRVDGIMQLARGTGKILLTGAWLVTGAPLIVFLIEEEKNEQNGDNTLKATVKAIEETTMAFGGNPNTIANGSITDFKEGMESLLRRQNAPNR